MADAVPTEEKEIRAWVEGRIERNGAAYDELVKGLTEATFTPERQAKTWPFTEAYRLFYRRALRDIFVYSFGHADVLNLALGKKMENMQSTFDERLAAIESRLDTAPKE